MQKLPDFEFSRLESWSRNVLRPVFTSLGLEPRSLGLGLGLGTLESPDAAPSHVLSGVHTPIVVIRKSGLTIIELEL